MFKHEETLRFPLTSLSHQHKVRLLMRARLVGLTQPKASVIFQMKRQGMIIVMLEVETIPQAMERLAVAASGTLRVFRQEMMSLS